MMNEQDQLAQKIIEVIGPHTDKVHTEYPIKDKEWEKTGDTRKAKKADLVVEMEGQTIAFEIKTRNGRIGVAIRQAMEYQKHFDSACIITARKPRKAVQQEIIKRGIGLWWWKEDEPIVLS